MNQLDKQKEIDFWFNTNELGINFKHKNYYEFFELDTINGNCLEIGCGGSPFTTYSNNSNVNLTIVDPIINDLILLTKYSHIQKYSLYSCNFLEFNTNSKFNNIVCLNVLDHFGESHIQFLSRIKAMLKTEGKLFLYYDIRTEYSDNHYSINHDDIISFLHQNFVVFKESFDINPKHLNWSTVYKSYRGILINK